MPKIYRHSSGTEHIVCRARRETCGKVADWLFARGVKLNGERVWQIHWLQQMRKLHVTDYAIVLDADGKNATVCEYRELNPEYELIGEYHE